MESGEIAVEAEEAREEMAGATRVPASDLTERAGSNKLKLGESDVDTVSNRKSVFPTVGSGNGEPPEPVTELAPEADAGKGKKRDTQIAGKSDYGCLLDDETGNRHEVKDNIVVGREAPASPVVLRNSYNLKAPLPDTQAGRQLFIEDLHSTNGTYLKRAARA